MAVRPSSLLYSLPTNLTGKITFDTLPGSFEIVLSSRTAALDDSAVELYLGAGT